MVALVDTGASHNFIDQSLVTRLNLETEEFKGFTVTLVDGSMTPSKKKISQLNITLGKHPVEDNFYMVDMKDTDIILARPWIYSLGCFILDLPKL